MMLLAFTYHLYRGYVHAKLKWSNGVEVSHIAQGLIHIHKEHARF